MPDEYMEEGLETENEETSIENSWDNPPSIRDLNKNLSDAASSNDDHKQKVKAWKDQMNCEGAAKFKPAAGKSGIQPKLIKKQAEWICTKIYQ